MSRVRYRSQRPPARPRRCAVSASAGAELEGLQRHLRGVTVRRQVEHPLREVRAARRSGRASRTGPRTPSRRAPTGCAARSRARPGPPRPTRPGPGPAPRRPAAERVAGVAAADADRQPRPRRPAAARSRRPSATRPSRRTSCDRDVAVASTCSVRPSLLVDRRRGHDRDREAGDDDSEHRDHARRAACRGTRRPRRAARACRGRRRSRTVVEARARSRRRPHPMTAMRDRPADQHRRVHPQAQRDRVGQPRRAGGRARARRDQRRHRGRGGRRSATAHARPAPRPGRRTAAAPTSGCRRTRAAGWTSRTARASSATTRRWCPRPRAARTARRSPPAAIAAQVRALGESWHATAVSPVADQPDAGPGRPERERPGDRQPAGDVRRGGQQPEQRRRRPAPTSTAAASGASRPTAVPPSSSAWPSSSSTRVCRRTTTRHHHRDEDGVEHGHLGHRQLAEAVHVEDRAVERDERRAGVDRLGGLRPARPRSRTAPASAAAEA